jgi:7-cyano-7-deazaguanine synthase
MKNALSILSSGLDSSVATAIAARSFNIVLAVTFNYGQLAALCEIEHASRLAAHFGIEHLVIELPWLSRETKTALVNKKIVLPSPKPARLEKDAEKNAASVWVPGRNALLCAVAASVAEARDIPVIIAGFNAEEALSFPDNSREFVDSINTLFKTSSKSKIKLESPTLNMTKTALAKMLPELEIPPDCIWPCYRGGKKLCGRCESCARTIRAFKKAGNWKLIEERFE